MLVYENDRYSRRGGGRTGEFIIYYTRKLYLESFIELWYSTMNKYIKIIMRMWKRQWKGEIWTLDGQITANERTYNFEIWIFSLRSRGIALLWCIFFPYIRVMACLPLFHLRLINLIVREEVSKKSEENVSKKARDLRLLLVYRIRSVFFCFFLLSTEEAKTERSKSRLNSRPTRRRLVVLFVH